MELRDYQKEALDDCLEYLKQKKPKPGIVCAPTSYGKSLLISSIAHEVGEKVLVLQPSIELLKQNLNKLHLLGGSAEVYSSSLRKRSIGSITYATLGSVKNLGVEFKEMGITIVLVDECDNSYSPDPNSMFTNFIKALSPRAVIGFTATPLRLKNNSEGSRLNLLTRMKPNFFKSFIHIMQIQDMISRGYWTPIKYMPFEFDENLLVINKMGSEFTEESILEYNKVKGINNKIYLQVKSLLKSGTKNILVFCDSILTAKRLAEFTERSAAIYGDLPAKERAKILKDFDNGDIDVIYNYQVLAVGYDNPKLEAIIMGRSTLSFSQYYQIIGRGVRIYPGKKSFLFADYGGNTERFGPVENIRFENLDNYGWGMFSRDRLLTNCYLGGAPIYKKELLAKKVDVPTDLENYKLAIGQHAGKKLSEVERSYLEFMIYGSKFDFKAPKMKEFKLVVEKYLESTKMSTLK
jgi:DNA repair protein RadD